ncbi:hypothetical protein [Bacillus sp. AFS014408]|uniref:hypothetical protein n=1 Tax=Bacillus sp. AFS014408 TaxID=2034278 RepID=UPI00159687C0|nr:hypothetical protein [Bacillus sp. AFS014408]
MKLDSRKAEAACSETMGIAAEQKSCWDHPNSFFYGKEGANRAEEAMCCVEMPIC